MAARQSSLLQANAEWDRKHGSPLTAVAWLANTLGSHGVPLNAGDIILSGSLVPLEPAAAGDEFVARIDGLGSASIRFC